MLALLRDVWNERRGSVLARVDALEEALAAGLSGTLSDEQRDAARREAHTLAGSAGTFGFPAATRLARELEHALEAPAPPALGELPRLCEVVVALRRELERDPGSAGDDAGAEQPGGSAAGAPAQPGGQGAPEALLVGTGDPVDRLAAAATARGLAVARAPSAVEARPLLAAPGPSLVLVDLDAPDALGLVAEAADARAVLAIADAAGVVDPVDVARARAHGLLARDAAPEEALEWALEVRDRQRAAETSTVLAVDDDPVMLDAIRAVLEAGGYTVRTAPDGDRLLDDIARHRPDLVLLDIELPGADGVDLCRTVRTDRRWGALPIVFLTSRGDAETVRRVFAAGADDFVRKPFVGPELLARVAGRLERVRLFRAHADADALTGLANRRRGVERVRELLASAGARGETATVALLDGDGFQPVNRALGHAGGDEALRTLASLLREHFGGEDVLARWGGDEFLVAMPGMTEGQGRQRVGELLEAVRAAGVGAASGRAMTLSGGVAAFPEDGASADALLARAEEALAEAKRAGGDRVVGAGRAADAAAESAGPGGGGVERVDVALVEDDDVLGALLEHGLRTRGYTVRWLRDGSVAARELASEQASIAAPVVVLDWDLPGLDGIRVLRALREHGRLDETRVVMLSARASEAEVLRAFETGAVDHVAKPFSVPVLMQRIRRAMER
jgi:diguanylate cyclase (GGDEF)-like protein